MRQTFVVLCWILCFLCLPVILLPWSNHSSVVLDDKDDVVVVVVDKAALRNLKKKQRHHYSFFVSFSSLVYCLLQHYSSLAMTTMTMTHQRCRSSNDRRKWSGTLRSKWIIVQHAFPKSVGRVRGWRGVGVGGRWHNMVGFLTTCCLIMLSSSTVEEE